jgi:hypothetical protein
MTIIAIALVVLTSMFTIDLEPGATFDGGVCWEANGTEGMSMPDGQCMTPADYDAIFSFENLDSIPSLTPGSTQSLAAEAGLVDDGPASERMLGEGLVTVPFTFRENVARGHALYLPIAN